MRFLCLLILIIINCPNTFCQNNFREDFYNLGEKDDIQGQIIILKEWAAKQPDNAEMLIAHFNFYIVQSKKEILKLSTDKSDNTQGFELTPQDTSQKEKGFMYSETYYDNDVMDTAFSYINRGIELNPQRLDMRFGKIYMLGNMEKYQVFTDEIIKTIHHSNTNNNKWLWTENKPLDQPKEFMLNSIQDYVYQIYDTEDDSLLPLMIKIGETVLQYYPDNVASMSNISIAHMINMEYDKALKYLLAAEKLKTDDVVVLSNIAYAYRMKEDKNNAIRYYNLVVKYGDEESKKYAEEQIKVLSEK